MDAQSIQTAVYRLSARLSENLSETARDLGLQGLDAGSLAAGTGGAAGKYLEDGAVITEEGIRETKKLLETRREASMAEGLRRVLAMMLKGRSVLTFFPQVVQCLSSSSSTSTSSPASIQIRSLVSLYILRQARLEPDLALLPVNMYQKDLRDPNPVVRALALRTLSGMGLESIATLVLMSLKTASRDTNWFVRRTAAESLDKVYNLDSAHITSLLPILETLLADRNALVLGTSLAALEAICPERLDLLHKHYRRICRSLVDSDEWSQIVMLRLLERYARLHFADPSKSGKMDPDLELQLKAVEPLFYNRNAAVVLSAVRIYHRLAPASYAAKYISPLLRLLQAAPEQQAMVMSNVAAIAAQQPTLFVPHAHRFYVQQTLDTPIVRTVKLQVLVLLVNKDTVRHILPELITYTRSSDSAFVSEVVRSIGRCGLQVPGVREESAKVLLKLIMRGNDDVVHQALKELHGLITADDPSPSKAGPALPAQQILLAATLAYFKGKIVSPGSRAGFYQLLAEFLHLLAGSLGTAVDVLRIGLQHFPDETQAGKSSLLLLSTKLVLLSASDPPPFAAQLHQLHRYLTTLCRYDPSWTIRDLNRWFAALLHHAGVRLQGDAAAGADGEQAEDAFKRGDMVSDDSTGRTHAPFATLLADTEKSDSGQVKAILLARHTVPGPLKQPQGAADQLANWPALPARAISSSPSDLREPSSDDESQHRIAPTAFGSGPRPAKASGSVRSSRVQGNSSRTKREKVVLIPTESDPSVYAKPEVPRSRGLQEFLDSEDDDDEERLPQPELLSANAEDTEESSSEEEEEDDSEDESEKDSSQASGEERQAVRSESAVK